MSEEETFGNLLLQKEANKPDPRIPNENEKKKLKEIYSYLRSSELKMLFMLYPTLILIVMTYFLDQYPVAVFSIIMYAILMLTAILYLMFKRELIKRCPRCNMRGVPKTLDMPAPGKCPRCQMILEPSHKEK